MPDVRAHLLIDGRVQGVYYRESARQAATALGVTGWARNLPDGRVEAMAEGPREAVERLIAWCHQGPPAAHVTGVDVTWSEATGEFPAWTTRR
jgi:acylphosphatase